MQFFVCFCINFLLWTKFYFLCIPNKKSSVIVNGRETNMRSYQGHNSRQTWNKSWYDEYRRTEIMEAFIIFIQCVMFLLKGIIFFVRNNIIFLRARLPTLWLICENPLYIIFASCLCMNFVFIKFLSLISICKES